MCNALSLALRVGCVSSDICALAQPGEIWPAACEGLILVLHERRALHRIYGRSCKSVTGLKVNESGRLAGIVTRVTPVTRILKVVWISAFIPLFQIVP